MSTKLSLQYLAAHKICRAAMVFAVLGLAACLDEATTANSDTSFDADTLDAATLATHYNTELTNEEIHADLAKVMWAMNHNYLIETITDTLEVAPSWVNNCMTDTTVSLSFEEPAATWSSTSTWKRNGKPLKVCIDKKISLSEYYQLLDNSVYSQSQEIESDSVDATFDITSHYIASNESMDGKSLMVMNFHYKQPYDLAIQLTANMIITDLEVSYEGDQVLQIMSGRYKCAGQLATDDESDNTTTKCELTHAGNIVGEFWQITDENGDSQITIIDSDGNAIESAEP